MKIKILSGQDIHDLLIECGFTHLFAGNGCHEYVKQIGEIFSLQVNAECLTKIEDVDEPLHVGIFKSAEPDKPWIYQKKYNNLREMLSNEENIDFSAAKDKYEWE